LNVQRVLLSLPHLFASFPLHSNHSSQIEILRPHLVPNLLKLMVSLILFPFLQILVASFSLFAQLNYSQQYLGH